MRVETASIEDLTAIVAELPAFWGQRDLRGLHHHMLIHEFGETALVVRREDGIVLAYAFALLTPGRVGYIHLVAVRDGHRRQGLGQRLYEELAGLVRARGGTALRAITRPENSRSIAFHTALGFTAEEVPRYAWGEPRVVFNRALA
jgi:ribosomal protein S18 acetylase RimI-like enzyme